MTTDTSEEGLETLIMRHMTGVNGLAVTPNMVAISRLSREIELLREYRTRLVADVVTGKLDVRETAARLPGLRTDAATELAAETLDGAGNLNETEAEDI